VPLEIERRPDTKNLYLRGKVRGVRVRESCGTDDEETAEAIRARREWEILQGSVFGTKATGTFLAGVAVYLENGGERRFLQPLIDHFGATALDKIDQDAIDAAAKAIYPGLAPATISRQVYTPMVAVISAAALRKLCSPLKITRPKLPRGRVRWLTHDEAHRLIECSAPHLKPLVAFLLYTGARIGEALWLDWRYLDLRRGQVQFLDTKNGTDRGVPLHPALVAILAGLPSRGKNSSEVFRKADGMPYAYLNAEDDRDVSAGSRIKKGFRGACTRAGIFDFSPHDCRHTWATWHYQQNRDLNMLMHLGGWSSLSMVLRYAHVNVEHAAPSIHAMPAIGRAAKPAARSKAAKRKAAQ
jgi:integrase